MVDEQQFLSAVFWARELPPDERERARRGTSFRQLEAAYTQLARRLALDEVPPPGRDSTPRS